MGAGLVGETDARHDPFRRAAAGGDEAHRRPGGVHRAHLLRIDVVDAAAVDLGDGEVDAEGGARHDHQLVHRVEAGEVVARIGLGEAVLLRAGDRGGEIAAGADAVEHEIGGGVQHPLDGEDAAAARHPLDGLDDRHAAADRGREGELRAARLGAGEELGAVGGDHRLVGGHHVAAAVERRAHQIGRQVLAADRLDDEVAVDLEQLPGVAREELHRHPVRLVLGRPADRDPHHLEALGIRREVAVDAEPHGAETEESHPERPLRGRRLGRALAYRVGPGPTTVAAPEPQADTSKARP